MGVMVQDLQAKGLRPPPKKKPSPARSFFVLCRENRLPLPLFRPGQGLTAHRWIHFHSAASGFLNRT